MKQPPLHFSTPYRSTIRAELRNRSSTDGIACSEDSQRHRGKIQVRPGTAKQESSLSQFAKSPTTQQDRFEKFLLRQRAQLEYKKALAEAGEKIRQHLPTERVSRTSEESTRPGSAGSLDFWSRHYNHLKRREAIRPSLHGAAIRWQSGSVPTPLLDRGHPLYPAFENERQKIVGIAHPSMSEEDLRTFVRRQRQCQKAKEQAMQALQAEDTKHFESRFRSATMIPAKVSSMAERLSSTASREKAVEQAAYRMEQDAGFVVGGKRKVLRLHSQAYMEFVMRQEDAVERREEANLKKKIMGQEEQQVQKFNSRDPQPPGKPIHPDPARLTAFATLFSDHPIHPTTGSLFSDRRILFNAALNGLTGDVRRPEGVKSVILSESGTSVLNTGGGQKLQESGAKASGMVPENEVQKIAGVRSRNGSFDSKADKVMASRKPAFMPSLRLDHAVHPNEKVAPLREATNADKSADGQTNSTPGLENLANRRARRASIAVLRPEDVPPPIRLKRRGSLASVERLNHDDSSKGMTDMRSVALDGKFQISRENSVDLAAMRQSWRDSPSAKQPARVRRMSSV